MKRDFDKFYADAYAWILFLAQTEPIEKIRQLVGITPNASICENGAVRQLKFNNLIVDVDNHGCDTLDEFQDYMLELIQCNPDWVGPHKSDLYSEAYINAWVKAIKSLMALYTEEAPQYQLIAQYADIIEKSGFSRNLNPNA